MRNDFCFGLAFTLAFSVGVFAQDYKINKVGSNDGTSFDVLLNQTSVTAAPAGSWLYVTPIVPEGKVFKGFTVYDAYGSSQNERKVSNTETMDLQFLMPDHDVYVSASYESLRYYLTVKNVDNGSVSLSFNDRYRDRTKPGTKVTVNPNASNGYKVSSISVSKYLDEKTTVTCTKVNPNNVNENRCTFEMPNFDVEVSAAFVPENTPEQKNDNNRFNVFYELDGGALPAAFAQSFSCDSTAKLPVPTKDGYDFIGWSLENKLDNVYYALDRLDGSSCVDKRVYAVWTKAGVCPEQKAIAVDNKLPQCTSNLKCALFHSNTANQDSVCNGIMWVAVAPSSSSVAPVSSSSDALSSSSVVVSSSSSEAPVSSSVVSSSSANPVSSSSATPASSSSAKASSSSAAPVSSSSAKPASSSSAKASSSSAAPVSSSSAKPASSSSVKVSSSSAKPASSSSAKPASSSSKKASSSSAKPASSSTEIVVEAVATEEDLPSCTVKRENVTYYVSSLKAVFVCHSRMWTRYNPGPNAIAVMPGKTKFFATVNGRHLQISGAKVGSKVSLFDMQGRVLYNGRVNVADFSLNAPRTGSFLLRVGTLQKIVNIR